MGLDILWYRFTKKFKENGEPIMKGVDEEDYGYKEEYLIIRRRFMDEIDFTYVENRVPEEDWYDVYYGDDMYYARPKSIEKSREWADSLLHEDEGVNEYNKKWAHNILDIFEKHEDLYIYASY